MGYKEVILEMRVNKLLKGKKPALVFVENNLGRIYKFKKRRMYIMTINSTAIHFHALSRFTKKYQPQFDFGIMIKDIKKYTYQEEKVFLKRITFYTPDGFYLPISFFSGLKDTYETNINIEEILKELKSKGVIHSNILKDAPKEEDEEANNEE